MFYLLCVLTAAALFMLYRFIPNKKFFAYFCVVFALVFIVAAFVQNRRTHEEISRTQVEAIENQQKIFMDWYAEYQKDIDTIDRNWQLYHTIAENFKSGEIDDYAAHVRLAELEAEIIDEQVRIHMLAPPSELDGECKNLLATVIRKTQNYVDAQTRTITLTKDATDYEKVQDVEQMKRLVQDIMIRESPAGLFTANEIARIRDILTVPEENAK